jgi:hypothetical protein
MNRIELAATGTAKTMTLTLADFNLYPEIFLEKLNIFDFYALNT